jgi:NADH:ubiquinone oxidoreductase subunit F (NADH-binding)/NADH:ubiquinone oxidoreductase subunit E
MSGRLIQGVGNLQIGVWKSAKGKGSSQPKGRVLDDQALAQVQGLLGDRPRRRDLLIEFLHLLQDVFGHLSVAHLRALAEEMSISMAEINEVATFYAHFDIVQDGDSPPPDLTIRVCSSLSCELAGAQALFDALAKGVDPNKVRILRAPCMGRCETAPVVEVGHNHVVSATVEDVMTCVAQNDVHAWLPGYIGYDAYCRDGGYDALRRLRLDGDVDDVQEALLKAGLRGLGGAGFPSGRKWSFVRAEHGPKYLAVNGDEGEPGTFKDRYYLERNPHEFLEGMLIAAWAVQAEKVYIYLRDEYPGIRKALISEITKIETAGLVPEGYIDLRRGAGAYICGEESAMIESIEGKRGIPRHRPPYVAQRGIFNRPTLVHNVETLIWVARICRNGPQILSDVEKNGRKGLRSYSVSGRVSKPGVYVLPAGSTILDVIAAAGGMLEGHKFKAYQPGGPSSGLLPAHINHVPLDFDTLQPLGSFIGSAAVVVLSDHDSARAAAMNMLKFFEEESCGQCTPCRAGCEKAVKLMQAENWNCSLLSELCDVMEDASICGLGQAAPNPVRLTIKHFPEEI